MNKRIVGIATRGSKLALYQATRVKEELEAHFRNITFEIKVVKTQGDKILDVALSKIGDKGLFTKELEIMLLEGEADIAVNSLKDMPTELPEGLVIGGVLKRGDVRDALVSVKGRKLSELDETDIVATSSLRRIAQLRNLNKKIRIIDIRGNVDSRIKKMTEGYCTAQVMAAAGLERLGFTNLITEYLDPFKMLPAVGQGAIAIEIRESDELSVSLMKAVNDEETMLAVSAERVFLRELEGGCQIPVGCYSEIVGNKYRITGFVSNPDGTGVMRDVEEDMKENADDAALKLAGRFIDKGADVLISKIRSSAGL
jgi:hydroxymethylbilane synthase